MHHCPHHRLPSARPMRAGSFWGTTFQPGDVLDLTVDQMEALLKATSTGEGSKVGGWGCQRAEGVMGAGALLAV